MFHEVACFYAVHEIRAQLESSRVVSVLCHELHFCHKLLLKFDYLPFHQFISPYRKFNLKMFLYYCTTCYCNLVSNRA
jgi:hypothetical protein